jgi:formate dehydrogenase subunit gamma
MPSTRTWDATEADAIVSSYQNKRGALLPILHALQERFGYIDAAAVPLVAEGLNLSRADVQGVISFYRDFRATRPGRHTVKVCVAEACQARGSDQLLDTLRHRLDTEPNTTRADGAFTLETVYCLGNCALGPAALIDDHPWGRLTPRRLDDALGAWETPS